MQEFGQCVLKVLPLTGTGRNTRSVSILFYSWYCGDSLQGSLGCPHAGPAYNETRGQPSPSRLSRLLFNLLMRTAARRQRQLRYAALSLPAEACNKNRNQHATRQACISPAVQHLHKVTLTHSSARMHLSYHGQSQTNKQNNEKKRKTTHGRNDDRSLYL